MMEKDEAIKLIEQVCANYRGTFQEHQTLQEAVQKIKSLKESE